MLFFATGDKTESQENTPESAVAIVKVMVLRFSRGMETNFSLLKKTCQKKKKIVPANQESLQEMIKAARKREQESQEDSRKFGETIINKRNYPGSRAATSKKGPT